MFPFVLLAIVIAFGVVMCQNAIRSTGLGVSGVRSEFFARFAATPSVFGDLTTRMASTKESESYKWLGTFPQMREWGTGRQAVGLRTESYSVDNHKYELTCEVDRDEIADDQTGQIQVRINEMAAQAATHKDYLLGLLMQYGASSGYNSYDGVTFFNAAHSSGSSGSQDNDLTSLAAADDAVPTSAEFKTAFANAIAAMMAFKDDTGKPLPITPSGLAVLVPPALWFPAMEAMNATIISNTSNVLASMARVIPFAYIPNGTTTQTFYVCKTDGVVRPFIFQDREPIEFGSLTENTEEGFKREKYLYGVRARYALTYGYWQYCVRHVFTT